MRNIDGTQDWHTVFEDPENGLLSMIERCDTPDKLRACYNLSIDGLYSRYSDRETRDSYIEIIDELYENDPGQEQLLALKTKMRMIFQRIMHDRIVRANAFINSFTNDSERRRSDDDLLQLVETLDPVA